MEPFALANKTSEYDEAQTLNVKVLSASGSSIGWNLQTQQNAEVTLVANATMQNPFGWKKGRLAMLEVIQGGSGSYTLAWASNFVNVSSVTLNTAAGQSNVLIFKCIDNGKVALIANNSNTRS